MEFFDNRFITNVYQAPFFGYNMVDPDRYFDDYQYNQVKVQMGDLFHVKHTKKTYQLGVAGPCIAGVVSVANSVYVFHSMGNLLTADQTRIISDSQFGLIGGGWQEDSWDELVKDNPNLHNLTRLIPSRYERTDFLSVFVGRSITEELQRGIGLGCLAFDYIN